MKVELLNADMFADINKLKPITSPVLFQRGTSPDPNGLISNEIFGITTRDRKQTYAYIDLKGRYLAPHTYKVVRALFSGIDSLIDGSQYFSIVDGKLIKDEGGETGIKFLYDNWEKLKWEKSEKRGMRNERIDFINSHKKNELFMDKLIVIPAFYRDVTSSSSGGGETSELNNMYSNIIRFTASTSSDNVFDFAFNAANFVIQNNLNLIYEYFKVKLEKKNGMIRKYLMGKSVDNSVRAVITAPTFHANSPEELQISFNYCGVPVAQLCSLFHPFVLGWVKNFFDREFIQNKYSKIIYDPEANDETNRLIELDNPESYFSEKYIRKLIQKYIKNPESRFDPIVVPTTKGERNVAFRGSIGDTDSTIVNRPMNVTDLLFMAVTDVTKDKHIMATRYPLLDAFGVFTNKIQPIATYKTMAMTVNGTVYKHYPVTPDNLAVLSREKITALFIDALQFSNTFLKGLDGDYDGDQLTCKGVWSIEANAELDKLMKSKRFFLTISGETIRMVEIEVVQTFFTMTKDPTPKSKPVPLRDKEWLLSKKPSDFTFNTLIQMLGKLKETTKDNTIPKFNMHDIFDIKVNGSTITTTVGKYLFNTILFTKNNISKNVPYTNEVITEGKYLNIESLLAKELLNDKMTIEEYVKWLDTRDWLGFQLHAVFTTSFSPAVIKTPPEVKALKKQLVEKYRDRIEAGDVSVADIMEKQLIAKAKQVLKGDYGMDLYDSGARGNMSNNYKNMFLMRGAMKNTATGKFEVIMSSLDEGMEIKDITSSSNSIVAGAYPKAVGTQTSGTLAKELLAALQTETTAPEGSECGTKVYLEIFLDEITAKRLVNEYRYIMVGTKPILLTSDNMKHYVNKNVKLRSPMTCVKVDGGLCNHCVGDMPYKQGIRNVGLTGSRVATKLSQLNMKKFHDSTTKLQPLDLDKMTIIVKK